MEFAGGLEWTAGFVGDLLPWLSTPPELESSYHCGVRREVWSTGGNCTESGSVLHGRIGFSCYAALNSASQE
jgi:hypothetical protein